MAEYPEALDHMLAAWNEPDSTRVRGHLDQALSSELRFVDPTIDVSGIDGFEQNVHEVKSNILGAVYSRTSGVDSQHNFYRYHWAIHQDGKLLLSGFDVTQIEAEHDLGKIKHAATADRAHTQPSSAGCDEPVNDLSCFLSKVPGEG